MTKTRMYRERQLKVMLATQIASSLLSSKEMMKPDLIMLRPDTTHQCKDGLLRLIHC